MKTKKFLFEWANGSEIRAGKNIAEACSHIQTSPSEIQTGFLVRVKEQEKGRGFGDWSYWDAEQFWKHLKGKSKKVKR